MTSRGDGTSAVVMAVGTTVVDLAALHRAGQLPADIDPAVLEAPSLNALMACGPPTWRAVTSAVDRLVADGGPREASVRVDTDDLRLRCPVDVADYVDGYGGLHHATNLGRILRPDSPPLLPNWRHLPVAYHGRAGTVMVGGSGVTRPRGLVLVDAQPRLRPTAMLDIELEVGYIVGVGSEPGRPLAVDEAVDHVFGVVLVNDWSARDIQSFEYQPLGPYQAKSFATTISPWVVPMDSLRGHLVPGLAAGQEPPPAPHLRGHEPALLDLQLEVLLQSAAMRAAGMAPVTVSRVSFAEAMYWSMSQQLAHATTNGAPLRVGDLFASGTVSGADARHQGGSLMELTWGGTDPLVLPGGEERRFLEDGDRVTLRGWCGGTGPAAMALGEVDDIVRPAPGPVPETAPVAVPVALERDGDRSGSTRVAAVGREEDRALLPPIG